MIMLEKLEQCPDCGDLGLWLYDAQICRVCGHDGLAAQRGRPPRSLSQAPSSVIRRLERRKRVAGEIIDGLQGRPFRWGDGTHSAKRPLLEELGVTLVTETRLRKIGRAVKRGARPVGSIYFPAPIQRHADVYVLECQTKPEAKHHA